MTIILKPRRCKHCRTKFTPSRSFEVWCSPECGAEIAKAKIAKKQAQEATRKRVEHRKAKEQAKTRRDWVQTAQQATNAYIRYRDKDKPCVSCRKVTEIKDAGHFQNKSTHPELRFNEENIHGQCRKCNSFLHGNLLEYRLELIQRIGLDRVEWLESPHPVAKYSILDLQEITRSYRIKLSKLKADNHE